MTSAVRPTGGRPAAPAAASIPLGRIVLLLPGGIALLAGLDAALLLLGLPAPIATERLPLIHAPLLVFGFIGTLVITERAVAIRRSWAFISPALSGIAGIALLTQLPIWVGKLGFVAALLGLLVIYGAVWRRQAARAIAVQALGAVSGLAAALLWLGGTDIRHLAPSMAAFLILTIVGERMELARISPRMNARAERLGLAASIALGGTAATAPLWPTIGYPLLGLSVAALVGWLFTFDVATHLVNGRGLPRYVAWCLLAGYAWLGVAAGIWALAEAPTEGEAYDAVLHAVFLGFVLSMIMVHAPIILPAVLRRPLPYRPVLYAPVGLLHASLLLRVAIGDARGNIAMLQLGGAINVAAVLLFVVLAIASALMGPPREQQDAGGSPPGSAAPSAAALPAAEPFATERPTAEGRAAERPVSERPAATDRWNPPHPEDQAP